MEEKYVIRDLNGDYLQNNGDWKNSLDDAGLYDTMEEARSDLSLDEYVHEVSVSYIVKDGG